MGIGSNLFSFFKWVRNEILEEVNAKLGSLENKVSQSETDIKHLKDLCEQFMEKIAKLEGKYEKIEETIYQKVVNKFLNEQIKIQQKEINTLKSQISHLLPKKETSSISPQD